MLVDTEQLRPQNESFEHYFLKQVGRAYLFEQGIRCVGTEVDGVYGSEQCPFGTTKNAIDVLGVDTRERPDGRALTMKKKIEKKAMEIAKKEKLNVIEVQHTGEETWIYPFQKEKTEASRIEVTIQSCRKKACLALGYPQDLWQFRWTYEREFHLRGVEVKVSRSDYRNGFCMTPDYLYLLTPKGLLDPEKDEIPPAVGLLEFDFEQFKTTGEWKKCIKIKKKVKKSIDPMYRNKEKHAYYCQKLLFTLAQQNTEEHIFWNPFLKDFEKDYHKPFWDQLFLYQIGDKTHLGLVCDRKKGSTPKEITQKDPFAARQTEFYKLVQEGKGITNWISLYELENPANKDKE